MCVKDFWGCRLLQRMFQTRILNAEPTMVELFIFTPAVCMKFWNDHLVCVCARVHMSGRALWSCPYHFQRLSMDIQNRSCRWSAFRKVHLLWKASGSCFVWQGSQNTFLMCCIIFFLLPPSPPPPFCLIFHVGMEEEKDLLWINEDCFHLLRGAPFAFLRFWVGSQELQSTIEPASNVKWLLHSLWMMWAHRVPVPLMSVPVGSVK